MEVARRRVGVVERPKTAVRVQNTVVNAVVKEAWMADGTVVGRVSIAGAPVWTPRVSLATTAGRTRTEGVVQRGTASFGDVS